MRSFWFLQLFFYMTKMTKSQSWKTIYLPIVFAAFARQ